MRKIKIAELMMKWKWFRSNTVESLLPHGTAISNGNAQRAWDASQQGICI